jgi:hypothetical protein
VTPRARLKTAVVGFAIDAAFAWHPGLWHWFNKGKRRWLERPVWDRVARSVAGGVFLGAVWIYMERQSERLREEDPELYARIHADARR